jgi:hypothetical protein
MCRGKADFVSVVGAVGGIAHALKTMLAARPHTRLPIFLFICNAKVHAQSGNTEQFAKPLPEKSLSKCHLSRPGEYGAIA